MAKYQCPVTSTYKLSRLPNKPNYQDLDDKELKNHPHLLNGVNQQSYDSLLRSNKNKISQPGHSPKPLENLILSTLHQFLSIHPRHQCYQLDMWRTTNLNLIGFLQFRMSVETRQTKVYVRGNRPILSTIFYYFHIYIGDFDYNHTTVDEELFFQPSVLQVVYCILLLHIFAPSVPCYCFQLFTTIILFCNLHLKMLSFLLFLYKYFLQHCYSFYVK